MPAFADASNSQIQQLEQKFKASDKNGDGKLTLEEGKAGGMKRVVANFDKIDKSKKGYITLDEIKATMANH